MTTGELNRYIGKRGEEVFRWLIGRLCDGKPWFSVLFLGDEAVARDFTVTLIHPTLLGPCFCVSVKSTRSTKYAGTGKSRKLLVRVSNKDVKRLKTTFVPTYVVGIDIDSECGFIKPITRAQNKGFVGISTLPRYRLNCRTIKKLWTEVEQFWKNQAPVMEKSVF